MYGEGSLMPARSKPFRRAALVAAATTAVAVAMSPVSSGWAAAAAVHPATKAPKTHAVGKAAATTKPDYDARQGASKSEQKQLLQRAAVAASSAPVVSLQSQLGDQGIVDIDPLTLTPRQVTRLDGTLTGPSRSAASSDRPRLREQPPRRLPPRRDRPLRATPDP